MFNIVELTDNESSLFEQKRFISDHYPSCTYFSISDIEQLRLDANNISFIIASFYTRLRDDIMRLNTFLISNEVPILFFTSENKLNENISFLRRGIDLFLNLNTDYTFLLQYFCDQKQKAIEKQQFDNSFLDSNLLDQLMNSIPDTIYFKNTDKKFIKINRAQAKIIGVEKPQDAIGKSDFDFFNKEHAEKAAADEDAILSGGSPMIDVEEQIKDVDGREYWLSTTKNVIKDDDGVIQGIVGISRDITQRKETEKQLKKAKQRAEQSDTLKSAFLANMSHEIRTPMNTIIGFSELLKNQMLTLEERNEYLDYISEGGNSLLHLIDDIIDFAKIESGQIAVKKSLCKVNDLIEEIISTYEREKIRRGKDNLRIISDLTITNDDFSLFTDSNRLKQVLANLIQNSLKFTDEGYIKIGYTIEESEIRFYVKDTGIGIEKDKQEIIFDRFKQVDASLTRNAGGTGLGLAITKSIVELLGGNINLESSPGRGTTFYFTLPFTQVKKEQVSSGDLAELDTYSPNWDGKVFVIAEDENNNFRYLEAILKNTKAVILRAHNGLELVEIIKDSEFVIDLVLCDLKMPEMDGYAALNIIRNELKSDIPIIAQTAYAIIGERQKCIDMGFTDYLSKPIITKQLLNMLRKYLTISV